MTEESPTHIKSALRRGRFSHDARIIGEYSSDLYHQVNKHDHAHDCNPSTLEPLSSPSSSTSRKKVVVPFPSSLPTASGSYNSGKRHKHKTAKIALDGYGKTGIIQSRTSVTSLLLHRWNQSYWLHVHPASLVIFDSEEKMNKWKDYYDEDYRTGISSRDKAGHYHEMKKLVHRRIDFDTQGRLQEVINKYGQQHSSSSSDCHTMSPNTRATPPSIITSIAKYAMEEVRSKYYSRKGPLMHTCKISYLSNTGRNILVAFGSSEPHELKKIRSVIRYCINIVNKASRIQRGFRSNLNDDRNSCAMSAMTGMSAVSCTKYGEGTMDDLTKMRMNKRKRRMSIK